MEWLFWQVGGQGPMAGQLSHFVNYAPEGERDYGRRRYAGEYDRLLGVLDERLRDRDWIVGGEYTIADMICWPWVLIAKPLGAALGPFPHLAAWRARVKERPAVQRAVDLGKELRRKAPPDEAERKLLFEQSSAHLRRKGLTPSQAGARALSARPPARALSYANVNAGTGRASRYVAVTGGAATGVRRQHGPSLAVLAIARCAS